MKEEKKIYIGNLNYDTTEDEIRGILEEQGLTPTQINLISDKYTGRPKGFGFVEFETEEQTQKAIELLNGKEVNGRTLKVSQAQKREPRQNNFGGGGGRFNRDRNRRY
jgi:RNA recognition motif-containing protein